MGGLNLTEEIHWSGLYSIKQDVINARLRYSNLHLLHRALVTKKKLKMFKIIDSNACDECGETESISHVLYDGAVTQTLLLQGTIWIKKCIKD